MLSTECLEFCHAYLTTRVTSAGLVSLRRLELTDPGGWVRSARFATLPPLPAQLALPVAVWPVVSSTVLVHLQPTLACHIGCADGMGTLAVTPPSITMHFSECSAGSYIYCDYRLLCRQLQQPCCEDTATVGALGCPVQYLVALQRSGLFASHMCGKTNSSGIQNLTQALITLPGKAQCLLCLSNC